MPLHYTKLHQYVHIRCAVRPGLTGGKWSGVPGESSGLLSTCEQKTSQ